MFDNDSGISVRYHLTDIMMMKVVAPFTLISTTSSDHKVKYHPCLYLYYSKYPPTPYTSYLHPAQMALVYSAFSTPSASCVHPISNCARVVAVPLACEVFEATIPLLSLNQTQILSEPKKRIDNTTLLFQLLVKLLVRIYIVKLNSTHFSTSRKDRLVL